MEQVSQAWKDNQKAGIHAPAFVTVTITSEGKEQTISSLDTNSDIKLVVHKRSFDPMGFEIPVNDLKLELYNFKNQYTSYYLEYVGQPIQINIRYGYILESGQEEIQGGVFEVDGVEKNDDETIVFNCVSEFKKNDREISINIQAEDKDFVIYDGERVDWIAITEEDWKKILLASCEDIIKYIKDEKIIVADNIDMPQNYTCIKRGYEYTMKVNEIIQGISNKLNIKYIYDRRGNILLEGYTLTDSSVLRKDMKSIPMVVATKQLKNIEINSKPDLSLIISSDLIYISKKIENFEEHVPLEFSMGTINLNLVGKLLRTISISEYNRACFLSYNPAKDRYKIALDYGKNYSANYLHAKYYDESETVSEILNIPNIPYGETCDIKNNMGFPTNTNAIIKYFSNRNIYEVDLRGDPSRDVGDMVFFEVSPGTFKKALILEDELTFDGVFTEKVSARIIDTDFVGVETGETDIKYFTISDGVLTAFDYETFIEDGLTKIVLPHEITEIADGVFFGCEGITEIKLHLFLKKIGSSAFEQCSGLTELVIPDSVVSVGKAMLRMANRNNNLKKLVLSDNITEIPDYFAQNAAIEDLYLPDNITRVGIMSFRDIVGNTIRLSNNLTSVGLAAFSEISAKSINIPSGLNCISAGAFAACRSQTDVFISAGVKKIEEKSFMNISNLTIFIPDTVEYISENTFYDSSVTIRGYAGTVAEEYANNYGYKFINVKTTAMN